MYLPGAAAVRNTVGTGLKRIPCRMPFVATKGRKNAVFLENHQMTRIKTHVGQLGSPAFFCPYLHSVHTYKQAVMGTYSKKFID
jgi:hypothetical protein